MICFAANSLLCRLALGPRLIDPASFTTVRRSGGGRHSGAGGLATLRAFAVICLRQGRIGGRPVRLSDLLLVRLCAADGRHGRPDPLYRRAAHDVLRRAAGGRAFHCSRLDRAFNRKSRPHLPCSAGRQRARFPRRDPDRHVGNRLGRVLAVGKRRRSSHRGQRHQLPLLPAAGRRGESLAALRCSCHVHRASLCHRIRRGGLGARLCDVVRHAAPSVGGTGGLRSTFRPCHRRDRRCALPGRAGHAPIAARLPRHARRHRPCARATQQAI